MGLVDLYLAHAFWWWVAAALIFLAVEVATGTSYLLWPSAAAGVVAALALAGLAPPGWDFALFAVLTIASTLTARRYLKKPASGSDINDPHVRLVGRRGTAVEAFAAGGGRVFVDGKEWAAEADGAILAKGDPVQVIQVLDGGRLKVGSA